MEDLENRVGKPFSSNWGTSKGRGRRKEGRSVHHIFSLKAFTRMESSFIPSKRFESSYSRVSQHSILSLSSLRPRIRSEM